MNKKFLSMWLPIVAAGTVCILVTYAAVQQSYRQNANDPQIEFARNASELLSTGFSPAVLIASLGKSDMSKSLSTFAMLFDDSGNLIGGSAVNGKQDPLLPPKGIFDYVRVRGEDRLTWQTSDGHRYATVVTRYSPVAATATSSSGFFLAARSLAEVEARTKQLGFICLMGWLVLVIVSAVAILFGLKIESR